MRPRTIIALLPGVGAAVLLGWAILRDRPAAPALGQSLPPTGNSATQAADPGEGLLELSLEAQEKGGIVVAPLTTVMNQPQLLCYGLVVNPSSLLEMRHRYATAAAQAQEADAELKVAEEEYRRAKELYDKNQNVSQQTLQAVAGNRRSGAAKARAAEQTLRAAGETARQRWGALLATWMTNDTPAFQSLVLQEALLLQITVPRGTASFPPPATATVQAADGAFMPARFVCPAPVTDPRIQGQSFYYMTTNPPATLCVVLVFFPVLTLSGLAGRLFAPLGIAYILAVIASLVVALTVTPALSLLLLGNRALPATEPPVVRWSKALYHGILRRVTGHPRWTMGGVLLLLGAGAAALPFLRGEFLPQLREADFIVHMAAMPGTSLEESLRLGRQVTRALFTIPSVRIVSQKTGRTNEGASTRGSHQSEIDANLQPVKGRPAQFSPAEVRKVLDHFGGLVFTLKTFLSERIQETISGYTASVVINLFGSDLAVLDRKGQEIAQVLKRIPGAVDVKLQSVSGTPEVVIRPRKDDLNLWGFTPIDVLDAVHAAYQGRVVGQVYDQNEVFAVRVVLDPKDRRSIATIGRVPVRSAGGAYVRLQELADIYVTAGRYDILHQGTRRVQAVTCDVSGRNMNAFVAAARKAIASQVTLPAGTYLEFAGTAEEAARSRRDLLVHSAFAGLGIVLVLFVAVRDYRNVLLLLLNLPFALVGGVLAALLTGGVLSLGSLVGFVTVFGITLRASIMMFAHYEHLVSVEGMPWGREAAWRGASERLAPILMTALVTAFGLLPLALGSHAAGREIEGPMAIVILGGLVTSTAINLLVLPTLAWRYGRFGHTDSEEPNEA